jgi:hypothetical protein
MNTTKTKTPGYNTRLNIYFKTNVKGQRAAYRFDWTQFRAFRMPIAEAEMWIATEQADLLDGNPMTDF